MNQLRILVAVHSLEIGGSQLNALDLAAAVRDRGHEVRLFAVRESAGPDGGPVQTPLLDLAEDRGLKTVVARTPAGGSDRAIAAELTEAARRHHSQVVHAHEFPMQMRALAGPYLRLGTPLVGTVMAMSVPRWLPGSADLIVGTEQLRRQSAARRRGPVHLMEPPVDTRNDRPGVVDGAGFRSRHRIAPEAPLVVIVARLVEEMKREGIDLTIEAFAHLRSTEAVLAVVGDGPARAALQAHADDVNHRLGRTAIVLTGSAIDPRDAYEAADVTVGMGGSALRGMAFATPLVVVGEQGFWLPCTPETQEVFFAQGFHGIGEGATEATATGLAGALDDLIGDEVERKRLGEFGLLLVQNRFGLDAAARQAEQIYRSAVLDSPSFVSRSAEAMRASGYRRAADMLDERTRARLRSLIERDRRHAQTS